MALVLRPSLSANAPAAADAPPSLASHQARAAGVAVDALPYVDTEIDAVPAMREAVNRLVADELRAHAHPPGANLGALAHRPFQPPTELLRAELDRVEHNVPLAPLDTTRYQLDGPPLGKGEDVDAWQAAVHNSNAQLQHQSLRLINLELMQKYGSNAWRMHNFQLEAVLKSLQAELEALQKQIVELNRARKLEQTQAAATLANLDARWYELTTKNAQIEAACAALEQQLAPLRPTPGPAPVDYHAHHYAARDADGAGDDDDDDGGGAKGIET